MRTTLSIEDDLLDKAKRQALDMGLTVSEVVNRVLRRGLNAAPAPPQTYTTITWGDPPTSAMDWVSTGQELDREELEWLRRKAML